MPFAGSPDPYPAPETTVTVTSELPPFGNGVGEKDGATVAVADPAPNSIDVGVTTFPVVAVPLHAMSTVNVEVVSPVRVRTNCAAVETT